MSVPRKTLHGDELRAVMPTAAELPWDWYLEDWWSIRRKGPTYARVYLNGHGTDHELRFLLQHPRADRLPCNVCKGTGRVARPATDPDGFLSGLWSRTRGEREHDPADENGLRSCFTCLGDGWVRPHYGAANDFIRAPGLHEHFRDRDLGSRGLSHPDKADVLKVLAWIDWLYPILLRGETP